ncbi:hypothetical protein QBC46DRAFT_64192 [Diplogelasinospora grovesii]|uniref:Uncharacterized protein n=1 Tax=Diplogelasinospora grovesii TaxID=303347 RepID=A0AAN6SAM9_9PEZI|nr:hypothetical protein QBC46DRAFT_64192 [Diplogelasinospora grovesii]
MRASAAAAALVPLFITLAAAAPTLASLIPRTKTTSCTTIVITSTAAVSAAAACPAAQVATVTVGAAPTSTANNTSGVAPEAVTPDAAAGVNVQSFAGSLGGPPPPVISSAGDRPFSVDGNTFVGLDAALGRSCDVQHNACANAANKGELEGGVGQCDQQSTECRQSSSKRRKRELSLGECTDPTILFQKSDDRNETAFIAANQNDFNHGSALNIGVIADFICQRLASPCQAGEEVQKTCSSASAAAVATDQDQKAADVFNGILGGNFLGEPETTAGNSGATTKTTITMGTGEGEGLATTGSVGLMGGAGTQGVTVLTFTSCS